MSGEWILNPLTNKKILNLIGNTYENLKVVCLDTEMNKKPETKRIYWKCICNCGSMVSVDASKLKSGKTKSCGCAKSSLIHKSKTENLIGQKFGRLTVVKLNDDYEKGKGVYWNCICDCGQETISKASRLKNKTTQSCGCYNKERVQESQLDNLTGRIFGKLKVMELDRVDIKKTKWICKCECGNIKSINASSLKRGYTKSCGCITSKGECKIREVLTNKNIKFEQQKTFDGLIGINGGLLSYDFYLCDYNILIEYQGEFHDGSASFQSKDRFKRQKEHDERKKEYASKSEIELFEIWYWDYDNIEEILNKNLE